MTRLYRLKTQLQHCKEFEYDIFQKVRFLLTPIFAVVKDNKEDLTTRTVLFKEFDGDFCYIFDEHLHFKSVFDKNGEKI